MSLDNTCRCDFTADFLFFDEPLCQDKWLILSGRIFGTSKSNRTTILKHLQLWVEKQSKLVVEGITLETSKYSSVFLQEGEQAVCQDNQTSPSSSDPESSTLLLYIIPVALALVVVSIIVVVVCIIVIRVYKKKIHSRYGYLWFLQSHLQPLYFCTFSMYVQIVCKCFQYIIQTSGA